MQKKKMKEVLEEYDCVEVDGFQPRDIATEIIDSCGKAEEIGDKFYELIGLQFSENCQKDSQGSWGGYFGQFYG